MIEFTTTQLLGLCVALLLIGGSLTVYGIRFLEWSDRRRAKRRLSSVDLPEQRTAGHVRVVITADPSGLFDAMHAASDAAQSLDVSNIDPEGGEREAQRRDSIRNRTQARADSIRDEHLARRRLADPPPEGMEDRVIERLHALGDDLRDTDTSSSNPTTEENPDGR